MTSRYRQIAKNLRADARALIAQARREPTDAWYLIRRAKESANLARVAMRVAKGVRR